MPLNIGDLTFAVSGSTAGLQKSVDRILEFGKVVDQVARSQQEGAQATIKAYVAQERALKSALQQTLNMQQKIKAAGGPSEQLARTTNAFKGLTSALTNGKASSLEYARAQDKFRLIMGQVNRDLQKFNELQPTAGKGGLSTFLRDISSSAVIAVGPLSGVASRISAISAMAERSSLSMAAVLAGLTAGAIGLGLLASSAVTAAMQVERIQAVLEVGAGSATAAANEFKYVHDEAIKMGLSIDTLATNYANLTAATQNTSLAGEQTRRVFEAVATTSRALRMSQEATTGVFLALTQMVSKGVVYNEELTQQLSERIPGAFKIAADSMGVTTQGLKKMMSEGTLLTSTFLPKFADQLEKVFGSSAAKSANSLDASIQNLSTSMFDFSNAFNQTLGVSTTFKSIVNSVASSLSYMSTNMDTLVGLVGALTGAITVLAARSLLGLAIPAFMSLVTAVQSTIAAIRTAGITLAVFQGIATGGLSTILTLVATLGGAVAGYYAFKPAAEDASTGLQTLTTQMTELTAQAQKNISVMPELAAAVRDNAAKEIENLKNKIVELTAAEKDHSFGAFLGVVADEWKRYFGMDVEDKTAKLGEYKKQLETLQALLNNFNTSVASVKPATENVGDLINNKAANALQKALDQIKTLRQEADLLATGASDAEIQRMSSIMKMTNDLNNAKVAQSEVNKVTAEYANLLTSVSSSKALRNATEATDKITNRTMMLLSGQSSEMVSMTEDIQNFSKGLKDAGVSEDEALNKTLAYAEAQYRYKQVSEQVAAVNKVVEDSFSEVTDSLTDVITGTKDAATAFSDMVTSILSDLTKLLLKESISDPLSAAVKSALRLGTSAATGTGIFSSITSLLGFESGGSVQKNKPVIVGENGKEVFVPETNGKIIPNSELSSGASPVFTSSGGNNITLQSVIQLSGVSLGSGSSKEGDKTQQYEEFAAVLEKKMKASLMDFVADQSRFGGVFYDMRT